jgi:hypothetical protein
MCRVLLSRILLFPFLLLFLPRLGRYVAREEEEE